MQIATRKEHNVFVPKRGMLDAMWLHFQKEWQASAGYQQFLAIVGVIMLISGVFHVGVYLVEGGPLATAVSWRKPITFGLSFGLNALSIAWVMSYLPKQVRRNWWLLGILGVAELTTVVLVTMQQWRGAASHFNFGTTPFNAIVAGSIIVTTIPVATIITLITMQTFRQMRASSSLLWAIRIGLVLMLVSFAFGFFNAVYARLQFVYATGLPQELWGEAGVLKIPHGVALHAFQILGVAAWLLQFVDWPEQRRFRVVGFLAGGCIGMITVGAVQTFRGLGPLELDLITTVALLLSVIAVGWGYLALFVGLLRRPFFPAADRLINNHQS